MKRVAWFTPLPPVRSGIARYSVELLARLGQRFAIDVFVDTTDNQALPGAAGVFSAHNFVWKHAADPYALIVYQLGNAPCHDYMWPYLVRFPGLVTLHDGQLHHSRARRLQQENRPEHYRAEFCYNHPETDPVIAELGTAGLLGALTELWPMRRVVLTSSLSMLVHNTRLAEELHDEGADVAIDIVEMGVPEPPVALMAGRRVRASLGISPDVVLFAAFGKVTPEKRVTQALRALASLASETPWHMILCGEEVDHYDPRADARRFDVSDRVTVTGYIDEDEMPGYVDAADVCLCLRWPSSRETSASWLRCLAAGKPTIVTDLVHLTDVRSLDPRDWTIVGHPTRPDAVGDAVHAACVSIDIVDEDHSLGLALRRLSVDRDLRKTLGRTAGQLWTERFTLERMALRYEHVMERVYGTSADACRLEELPLHLRCDGMDLTSAILEDLGLDNPLSNNGLAVTPQDTAQTLASLPITPSGRPGPTA